MLEKDIGHNHWNENKLVKMKRYPEFKNADVHYDTIKLKKLEGILVDFLEFMKQISFISMLCGVMK